MPSDSFVQGEMLMRILAVLVALIVSTATAFAQGYPNKSVRVVVGFAAGGPADVMARLFDGPDQRRGVALELPAGRR